MTHRGRIARLRRLRLGASPFIRFAACSGAPSHRSSKAQDHADFQVGLQQGFVTDGMGFRVKLHGINFEPLMSALGHKRTLGNVAPMSALPPIADITVGPAKFVRWAARNHPREFASQFRRYGSATATVPAVPIKCVQCGNECRLLRFGFGVREKTCGGANAWKRNCSGVSATCGDVHRNRRKNLRPQKQTCTSEDGRCLAEAGRTSREE